MPVTPDISADVVAGGVRISIAATAQAAPVRYSVLRDGRTIAQGLTTTEWIDRTRDARLTQCYSVVARFEATGLSSQPSAGVCLPGSAAQRIAIDDPRLSGDATRMATGDGVAVPTLRLGLGQRLSVRDVTVHQAGLYAVSIMYDNHVGPLHTGITNAVKRLTLTGEGASHRAVVQMPHIAPEGATHPVRPSARAYMRLQPGRYRLDLDDFINMSALTSNATYRDRGGSEGPVNEARIAEIHLDLIE